jgi:hypothetical protein
MSTRRTVRALVALSLGLVVGITLVHWAIASHRVTMAHYDQIKEGLTYQEVVGIVGRQGDQVLNMDIPGVPEATFSYYTWKNSDGSTLNAKFIKGRLTEKTQTGLR